MAQKPNHDLFTPVLQEVVGEAGMVDYEKLVSNREPLRNYLNELITHPPKEDWKKEEVLAYWINTYNAFTLKLIADNYPVKSIRDIKSPWEQKIIPYKGQNISLNHVEHQILRTMNEPRIHFAINCASISCPVLADEAYLAENLNEQLDNATRNFLNDTSRNLISKNSLQLSKIFKWFKKDFTAKGDLTDFLNTYTEIVLTPDTPIKYLEYNWDLNEQ
ncbi:DUF547 domain-containing protein [Robertkochia marina]|nr:DUF547 domain-containing protein [Robertkochia marina]